MKFGERLDWKNNWSIYGLLFLFIPAFCWWGIWSDGTVLKWWRTLEGRLADPVFFEWEEFIALHSHNNEWLGRCGFYLILITGAVFLLLRLARVIRTDVYALLMVMSLAGFVLIFSICMCQSKEKNNRRFCFRNLKNYASALTIYTADFHQYPAVLPEKEEKNEKYRPQVRYWKGMSYLYPGAGEKTDDSHFVVIEDAPRTHAGDLRHRLWSDGKIESYYPWKTEGGGK